MKTLFDKIKDPYVLAICKHDLMNKLDNYQFVHELPLGVCLEVTEACGISLMEIYDIFE